MFVSLHLHLRGPSEDVLITRPIGLVFKQYPRDQQMLTHEKTCVIPILNAYARLCNEPVSLSVFCKVKTFCNDTTTVAV